MRRAEIVTLTLALALAGAAASGCGDNRLATDAPAGDSPRARDGAQPDSPIGARDAPGSGAPDLKLLTSQMDGTVVVTEDTFTGSDCEIVEGCVGSAGTRTLVRFDTVVENAGTADLDLGPVPPPGVSSGIYVWSACHMHHHVMGFADYTISDATGVVTSGHKQGFCIEDSEQVDPVVSHGYTCNHQGITPGWADVYSRYTACQWIDVTGLPSGTYTLNVTVDGTGVLPDANPTNNTWTTTVAF
jgi:hypothetical protein